MTCLRPAFLGFSESGCIVAGSEIGGDRGETARLRCGRVFGSALGGSRSRLLLLSGYERGDGETSISRHLGLIGWPATCHASSRGEELLREINSKKTMVEERDGMKERKEKKKRERESLMEVWLWENCHFWGVERRGWPMRGLPLSTSAILLFFTYK